MKVMTKGLINQKAKAGDAAKEPDAGSDDTSSTSSTSSMSSTSSLGTLHDPLLRQVEQKIESELTPENRINYLKIVLAGMHAALDGGPISIMAKLRNSKNPTHDCVVGAVTLVFMLRKQAKGVMPLQALVPAGLTLTLKALDFAETAKLIPPVDQRTIVAATHLYTSLIFQAFKISPRMLATAAHNIHAISQDPGKMRAIELKAGTRAYGNDMNVNAGAANTASAAGATGAA